ncbi:hypothetical protein B0H12DRAFT_197577 [Mycena haematopus]|nr:hypothetical protein B0H12DRAFT_197577 [Mycena haematopus]
MKIEYEKQRNRKNSKAWIKVEHPLPSLDALFSIRFDFTSTSPGRFQPSLSPPRTTQLPSSAHRICCSGTSGWLRWVVHLLLFHSATLLQQVRSIAGDDDAGAVRATNN